MRRVTCAWLSFALVRAVTNSLITPMSANSSSSASYSFLKAGPFNILHFHASKLLIRLFSLQYGRGKLLLV